MNLKLKGIQRQMLTKLVRLEVLQNLYEAILKVIKQVKQRANAHKNNYYNFFATLIQ